CLQDIQLPLNF
nr:immunoglobulin light chain junction region [Macaca mulatta]